jgi:O-antigen/teichoic acid export membrane protein
MQKESLKSQVAKSYFWNFLMLFIIKLGGLLFVIIAARILLPAQYGIYSLAIATAFVVFSLAVPGSTQALSKYLAESISKKDNKSSLYFKYLFRINLILGIASALLVLILAFPLAFFIFSKPEILIPLFICALYIFLLAIQNFYESAFYAIKKVNYLTVKEIFAQAIKIGLILLWVMVFSSQYRIYIILFSLIFSSIFSSIFLSISLRKEAKFIYSDSKKSIDKVKVLSFIKGLVGSNISSIGFYYAHTIILGIFLSSLYIGYYSAAISIMGGLYGFMVAGNILLPVFAQIRKQSIPDAFNSVFKYLSLISIPFIFGSFILGKYLIVAVYGYDYLQASVPLIFLSFLVFEYPISDAIKSLFYAEEMPKKVMNISIISTILNIILIFTFILLLLSYSSQFWAMVGVAIATLISRLFILTLLWIEAKKDFGIYFKTKNLLLPIISGAVMAIILYVLNNYMISDMNLLVGILEVIFGGAIYFGLMFLLKGITKEDFSLIKKLYSSIKSGNF